MTTDQRAAFVILKAGHDALHEKRPHVAHRASRLWARFAALVGRKWRAVRIEAVLYGYLIDRRAAWEECMRLGRSAVVLQWSEHWVWHVNLVGPAWLKPQVLPGLSML